MNYESLALAIMAAWILEQLVDKLVKPAWEKFNLDLFWLGYVAVLLGSLGGWATGINALPVFDAMPMVGRIITCLCIGAGSTFIYDLQDRAPSLPEPN